VERLPDTIARLVEFDLLVTDAAGKTKASRYRILTTLLDHQACPAKQVAAVYAERWQAEIAYYRIKVSLRGTGVALRGRTPRLAAKRSGACSWSTTPCATWLPKQRSHSVSTPTRSALSG
jgi:hypothetical protein